MAEKQQTEIDAGLLEELRRVAREQDRREDEVLEEAVRRYLTYGARRSRDLIDLFDRIDRGQEERGVEPLSDEEAMRLANDELHAWRDEQTRELP
ncbi:MAG: hypothetical protein WKF95_18525 [Rubrobacter sp.]